MEAAMTAQSNNNRLIAEYLGLLMPTVDETAECHRYNRTELHRWTLHRTNGAPIVAFSSYYWEPPDFYTDEAANAMLRDEMFKAGFMLEVWPQIGDPRFIVIFRKVIGPQRRSVVEEYGRGWLRADILTGICNDYIQWKESEVK